MRGIGTSVRDLLRSLEQPDRLRRSPLVAAQLEGLDDAAALSHVRSRVESAIAELARFASRAPMLERVRRRQTILWRCDLLGEKHEVVARALGLSRRQFYRERKAALVMLERVLSPVPSARVTVAPDRFLLQFTYAKTLALLGKFDSAVAELRQIAMSGDTGYRVRSWTEIARIASEERLEDAGRALSNARRARYALTESRESQEALLDADILLAESVVNWHRGRVPDALNAASAAVDKARAMQSADKDMNELYIASLIEIAEQRCVRGDSAGSLGALSQAQDLLDAFGDPNPQLRAALLLALSQTQSVTAGRIAAAQDNARIAYSYAIQHRLVRYAFRAAIALSAMLERTGRLDDALSFGLSAMSAAHSVCSAKEFGFSCLIVSGVAAKAKQPALAIELVRRARKSTTTFGFESALVELAEAEALLAYGRHKRAAAIADAAAIGMERLGLQRFTGSALRVKSAAQLALGDRQGAQRTIDEAISLLERYGHAYSLAQAYLCASQVAQNRQLAHHAAELLQSI